MKTEEVRRTKESMHTCRLFVLVISLAVAFFAIPALSQYKLACTCLPPPSPSDEFGVSRAVFAGRVIAIQVDTTQPYPLLRLNFQVNQRWKGVDSSQISVYTAISEASCGFSFHVDSTYLVYAYQTQYALMTNLCMRTKPLSRAAEDLAFLTTVSVERYPGGAAIPLAYELSQNYPNPFNPSTTISYALPKTAFVSLRIFHALGQEVALLVGERKDAGFYQITWNGSNVPSGIYFYRLQVGDASTGSARGFVETKKMILLK